MKKGLIIELDRGKGAAPRPPGYACRKRDQCRDGRVGTVRLARTWLHLSTMTTDLRCGLRHATQPTYSASSKPTTGRL